MKLYLYLEELKLQLFSYKNASQLACKIFAMKYSFTDHLKHKVVNKTICRMLLTNPR